MTHVVTLIANSARPMSDALGRPRPTRCRPAAPSHGSIPASRLDIPFTAASENDNRSVARQRASAHRSAARRSISSCRRRPGGASGLLLADMDSTMIGQECVDELADFVGHKARVAAITERAMRGEIEFAPALRERVALLAGLPAADHRRGDREKNHSHAWSTDAGPHHAPLRRLHVPRLRRLYRFHRTDRRRLSDSTKTAATGSSSARTGGFPARSPSRCLGATPSSIRSQELRGRLGLAPDDTLVVGDGANDLLMISRRRARRRLPGKAHAWRKPPTRTSTTATSPRSSMRRAIGATNSSKGEVPRWLRKGAPKPTRHGRRIRRASGANSTLPCAPYGGNQQRLLQAQARRSAVRLRRWRPRAARTCGPPS